EGGVRLAPGGAARSPEAGLMPTAIEVVTAPGRGARPSARERVRALEHVRPWRAAADVARCYALILLGISLAIACGAWWAYLLAFILIGTQQYALALIEHDGKHGMLMRSRWLNDLFARLVLCAPLGVDIDFAAAQRRHREHHHWLGTELDPIRHKYSAR